MKKPLVIGNWKMNGSTTESIKLVTEIINKLGPDANLEIALAPPFTAINTVEITLQGSNLKICAQNCHFENKGAFTGEISVPMLKDLGCHFVLIGHSERRHVFHESDEFLAKKLFAAVEGELSPVFCVGETIDQRRDKTTFKVLEEQIKNGFSKLSSGPVNSVSLAYEPVWAIGTGETASPAQVQEVHHHIRNFISILYDKPTAKNMRILYGGSVKPQNAKNLYDQADVDGLLIGGASLDSKSFADIVNQLN